MMRAASGWSVNVIGSRIEMVATGPNPGSTPIMVPRKTPRKPYMRFSGESAVENPRTILVNSSISVALTRTAYEAG
jgi:hypothetical protein